MQQDGQFLAQGTGGLSQRVTGLDALDALDDVEELGNGLGLVRLKVPDEVLAHGREHGKLASSFLEIVFADVAQAGGNRRRHAVRRLPLAHADDRHAPARAAAPHQLFVDLANQSAVALLDGQDDVTGAAFGETSVRGPGRREQ